MKRFILSVFSIMLATSAVAPSAQALPQLDPSFNLQTLRLREFDARNRLADDTDTPYEQSSVQTSEGETPQQAWGEPEGIVDVEETATESAEAPNAESKRTSSLTEQRLGSLDRS